MLDYKKTITNALIGLLILCATQVGIGQKYSQIGLNFSPLISQVIPFSTTSFQKGPYTVLFRRFNETTEKGWEFGIGMDVDFNSNEINFFTARFGYVRKRYISDKWTTIGNFDMITLFGGGFNEPGDLEDEDAGIGFSVGRSIEYEITTNMYIGTEVIAFFGLSLNSDEGPILRLTPPFALYLHIRLP
ncbi:MAG: hypothetical protein AAGK97_07630 [Bacteroidota bacterium]